MGVPGLVENGVNGLLVRPYEVYGLATATEYMCTHSEERSSMGIGGDRNAHQIDSESACSSSFGYSAMNSEIFGHYLSELDPFNDPLLKSMSDIVLINDLP